jgi:hypothetical protein
MHAQTDPPMEPLGGTERYVEGEPSAMLADRALATMMVRVGMASNALSSARMHARHLPGAEGTAVRMRNSLCSLALSAALINESIRLASECMATLRLMALEFRDNDEAREFLKTVSQLCAGKHEASEFLRRARNKLGFHWDADVVEAAIDDFAKNELLVWIEADADDNVTHRLASEVLGLALLPEAAVADPVVAGQAIEKALRQMDDANTAIRGFFTAAVFGYMRRFGGAQKERKKDQ